jgi:hypothetical protein
MESMGQGSIHNMSRHGTKGNLKQGNMKGLESIYLQRLEGAKKPRGKSIGPKTTKFRNMQDRFLNDPEFLGDELSDRDELASMIENNYAKMNTNFKGGKAGGMSARSNSRANLDDNGPNIFAGNRTKYKEKTGGGGTDFSRKWVG